MGMMRQSRSLRELTKLMAGLTEKALATSVSPAKMRSGQKNEGRRNGPLLYEEDQPKDERRRQEDLHERDGDENEQ